MKTFLIQTLGCKVNQYESEQMATLLRSHGLQQTERPELADLRIVNSCSVTTEAASKSRQSARRMTRLPVLSDASHWDRGPRIGSNRQTFESHNVAVQRESARGRVIVTGCWATSNQEEARKLAGVDAVLTHTDNVADELERLVRQWQAEDTLVDPQPLSLSQPQSCNSAAQGSVRNDGWMNVRAGTPGPELPVANKPHEPQFVKNNSRIAARGVARGATSLPLLDDRHTGHQRAFLKIQDGCDAHCTYCIIPNLRPALWSKPIDDVVREAQRLVDAGHREIVLTGIFLGAYGQATALRRRQAPETRRAMRDLIESLCTRVEGLRRLRLSSLEPGDLNDDLLAALRSHEQVVPHFHLPLQSGSDALLHRMNRQYTRDDFLRMIDRVRTTFDRPAITTDIIVGFPGETEAEFAQTLDVVDRAKFIHMHAFPFSPRPGTAAARWTRDFVDGRVVRDRIVMLSDRASVQSHAFRSQFVGEEVEILVERPAACGVANQTMSPTNDASRSATPQAAMHGRCERYFDVHVDDPSLQPGDAVRVRIDRVTPTRTFGTVVARVV